MANISEHILPGYIGLMDSYFDLLRKGELTITRGLTFTQVPDREAEEKLVVSLVEKIRQAKSAYIMLEFGEYVTEREEHQEDFTRFFSNIWELNDPSFHEEQAQYLARIERIMRRHAESDPERCSQLILRNVPPIAEMDMRTMVKFKDLLFRRMENSLPLFIFLREDYSQFLRDASRLPDIIWALDECTYPAERYLFHPYGLRYIAFMNRRNIHPHY